MAEKIKKLKVKQSNGSFGDYISLGADAKNIDLENGNTAEEEFLYLNTELLRAVEPGTHVEEIENEGTGIGTLNYEELINKPFETFNRDLYLRTGQFPEELTSGTFYRLNLDNHVYIDAELQKEFEQGACFYFIANEAKTEAKIILIASLQDLPLSGYALYFAPEGDWRFYGVNWETPIIEIFTNAYFKSDTYPDDEDIEAYALVCMQNNTSVYFDDVEIPEFKGKNFFINKVDGYPITTFYYTTMGPAGERQCRVTKTYNIDTRSGAFSFEYFEPNDGTGSSADLSEYTKTEDLSKVALSNSYNDLDNKPVIPSQYVLPQATTSTLGGIKVGNGLNIINGVLSVISNPTLPVASTSTLGGIKVDGTYATMDGETLVLNSNTIVRKVVRHGMYTGDGNSTRQVEVGFEPDIVLIMNSNYGIGMISYDSGWINVWEESDGTVYISSSSSETSAQDWFLTNGFQVTAKTGFNEENAKYTYVAFA